MTNCHLTVVMEAGHVALWVIWIHKIIRYMSISSVFKDTSRMALYEEAFFKMY